MKVFTPPSGAGTLVFPRNLGMFEWGGISVDPDRQVAIAKPDGAAVCLEPIPRGPGNPIRSRRKTRKVPEQKRVFSHSTAYRSGARHA